MSAWKKPQNNKTQQRLPQTTEAWVCALKVPGLSFTWFLWERGSCCSQLHGDGSPLSTCLDGQLERKGICAWVPQAKTDAHSPLLLTMVGSQHWCAELLYFVLSILLLLNTVSWGVGLGRIKMCHVLGTKHVCFMPVKMLTPLQGVEQYVFWTGHRWSEFSWW